MKRRRLLLAGLICLGLLVLVLAILLLRSPSRPVPVRRQEVVLRAHTSYVHAVAFAPDGKTLASGTGVLLGQPGEVILWDLPAGRPRAVLPEERGPVQCLAFSPDGDVLAAAGMEG